MSAVVSMVIRCAGGAPDAVDSLKNGRSQTDHTDTENSQEIET